MLIRVLCGIYSYRWKESNSPAFDTYFHQVFFARIVRALGWKNAYTAIGSCHPTTVLEFYEMYGKAIKIQ